MKASSEGLGYDLPKEEILTKLATKTTGLSVSEAADRLLKYGPNRLTAKKKISALSIYLSQFNNSLILILLAAAGLILFVYFFGERDSSDLIEAGLIFSIIILITLLGFAQEWKAEKAVEALKRLMSFNVKVKRDNKTLEIETSQLVPGDIVIIEEGMKVPADIRLLEVATLGANEASLTGESAPVTKNIETDSSKLSTKKLRGKGGANNSQLGVADQKNMIFAGTIITQGRGLGVVIRTGDSTEIGKIATSVADVEEEQTPIQKRLNQVGKIIGFGVLAIAAIVFVFIVFFATDFAAQAPLQRVIHSAIAAIALAVAAIPEGLPAVVTIALALGTQRMLKRKTLVRKLNSIETLGSTDVICCDKTGTLTKGEMTVKELYFDGQSYEVKGTGYETSGEFCHMGKTVNPKVLTLLLKTGQYCNNSEIKKDGILGDPTEAALQVVAAKAKLSLKADRVKEVPFSSQRKMMSVLVREGKETFVYTKGAPEAVLGCCQSIFENGRVQRLTPAKKKVILKHTMEMSEKALRTLAFAYRDAKPIEKESDMEKNLIFVGLQGMIDPPRAEVKPLIDQCHRSGIRIIMITGDHAATAHAVANEIGISGAALSGEELDSLSDSALRKTVLNTNIYARVNPGFKMRIVQVLKAQGHIVAMTGDGVNDAPALKAADIGIAMGITGTDVAKEASDMVLLDDHFTTIVSAIEEGRGVFDNIRKFVNYLLSCNIGEVFVVFLAVMLFREIPLTATMLLWINVVTDGLPAVALGLDPAEKSIMSHSPKKFQGEIITKRLWVEMIVFGLLMTLGVLVLYYSNLPNGLAEARGIAFMSLVIFELVRLCIIRVESRMSFFSNPWLLLAIVVSIILQLAISYIPTLSGLFGVLPIDAIDWLYIGLWSLGIWFVFELILHVIDQLVAPQNKIASQSIALSN